MSNRYDDLLNICGCKKENANLVRKLADYYELINNYKDLNAEQLIKGAKIILRDRKIYNYRHVAIRFLETAIQKGSDEAKFVLAKIYYNGRDNHEDNEKAAALFKELAESGNVRAKRIYADMIYFFHITNVEREDCVKLYKECSSKGDLIAKYRLANIYRNGDFADKPDYEMATWYYESCLSSEYNEKIANTLMTACCREALHCQLESFYLQEANATRNYEYYKKRPSLNSLTKKYLEYAEQIMEYLPLDDRIAFENSIKVYKSIIKDDSLDISKISYGEFREKYFKKHPRIFLTTKKTEYLIYKQGLRNYFLMRDDAAEEKEYAVEEKEKQTTKKKTILVKALQNLSIAKPTTYVTANPTEIEESVDDSVQNFKNNYNVDYSLCVTNLDKYLEEIMYQIFVVGLTTYKKKQINQSIIRLKNTIIKEISSSGDLSKLAELIVGDISKIPTKNHKRIVEKFIKDIETNSQGSTTAVQIQNISNYYNGLEQLSAADDFLFNDILELYDECARLRGLKIKETFTFGELFDIAFVGDKLGETDTSTNMLKMDILEFANSVSKIDDKQEIYYKLNELILKLEHFRVMVRNVASHKSVLTQRAIENGLNICITQESSIFNLLDELFGDYIEKQTYIEETKKYLKKSKIKYDDTDIDIEISNIMDSSM